MVSFFSRTERVKDDKPPLLGEKDAGEVTFVDTAGGQHTAQIMFLAGQVVPDSKVGLDPRLVDRRQAAQEQGLYAPVGFSPRTELVRVALEERKYFSRSIANRMWAGLLGRGLVHPVDQMHSQNPSSIPGLVEWLGDDLAAHGYDLDRLVAGIVQSRVYQLSSDWSSMAPPPAPEHFARGAVRALSPRQFALSLVAAAGDGSLDQAADAAARAARRTELEGHALGLVERLDKTEETFQSSVTEALYMSNDLRIQQLAVPGGNNLASRLAGMVEDERVVETAVWTILGRAPEVDEAAYLAQWLARPGQDRGALCRDLVWALIASAEFRFNH
jgi:hypothetical protein